MEEKKTIAQNDLEQVAGGIDTIFFGEVAVCPVCGERPIKKISGDEYVDTYQCSHCGSLSIHTKKQRPEAPKPYPSRVCEQCGSLGRWRVLKSANGMDTIQCTVCRLETVVPSEPY